MSGGHHAPMRARLSAARVTPRSQPVRAARAVAAAAVGCAVLASCTAADPPPNDARVAAATNAAASPSAATAVAASTSAAPAGVDGERPLPSMTPLDTVRCVVTRALPPRRDLLPARVLWPSGTDETGQSFETVTGAPAQQCPGELPTAGCRPNPPWETPLREDFVVASGAVRLVDGSSATFFAASEVTGVTVPNRQWVRYSVLNLRRGDPRGAVAYLERVMRECAGATSQPIGRTNRLVGTTRSFFRQGPATVVLLTGLDAAAWLVVDGSIAIDQAELARVVGVAASRLLPS